MEKRFSLKFVITLVLITSASVCLLLSLLFLWQINSTPGKSSDTDGFSELLDIISTRYIGTYDVDDLSDTAMRAAVDSLDDQWSFYMSPGEYADYLESSNNRYTGIGVEVLMDEEAGGIKVMGVYPDSGADAAGITAGDIITAVDGESIRDLTLVEIRALLRRPINDTVLLTVLRENGEYQELTVVYSVVFTDPVSYEMVSSTVGYIVIRNFETGAADGFINAVNALIEQGAEGFIYDVRSNNGGKVTEMTQILDFLLPEGEIFISVDRSGKEEITLSDAGFIDLPAVVLINRHSYSAAEYFTAMLSEYGYAQAVGEQTTGKNRMQTTIPMSGGGAVHISTGEYLTKNRVSLYDTGGFTPDFLITLSDDELAIFRPGVLDTATDTQFKMALSLLKD